jgi:6-pyruvoyltetrahydropterin/6-carboxytetrahydropterin synthase
MSKITAERYHDISCGHRVVGHESKCRFLHGHNYRIWFYCAPESGALDTLGRVVDFSVIKTALCAWLEDEWDHKTLIWEQDPMAEALCELTPDSIVLVPFNPSAENMGEYLLGHIGPTFLAGTGAMLVKVIVSETRKCSATVEF